MKAVLEVGRRVLLLAEGKAENLVQKLGLYLVVVMAEPSVLPLAEELVVMMVNKLDGQMVAQLGIWKVAYLG